MGADKKMIVMDLDGTLLNKDNEVDAPSVNYLKQLKNNGYIITIATGRIFHSALLSTNGAKFANYIVTDTGATIYKNNKWENIYHNLIPKKIVTKIFNYFDETKFENIFVCNQNQIYNYTKHYAKNTEIIENFNNKNEILCRCKNVTHMAIGFLNNKYVDEYYKILSSEMPELNIIIMQNSFGISRWIEITKKRSYKI